MKFLSALIGLSLLAFDAMATNSFDFVQVPTLDDFGLIALAALVGGVGAIMVRRNNRRK